MVFRFESRPRLRVATVRIALLAIFAALAPLLASTSRAATPPSATLSPSSPSATWTGSIFGAGTGEGTCVDGVSCDSFQVVLAPGDYTGKQINVSINWTVPAYDYDLYVHVGTLRGSLLPASAGPPPATQELVRIGIDPPVVTAPRTWWAHIQAASVPPGDVYTGVAAIVDAPPSPVVVHLPGSITFSRNVPLFARGTVRTLEPSVRVDVRGNCYVAGIRGTPAGTDAWRFDLDPASPTFDPEMRNAHYLGKPDAFQQQGHEDSTAGGADGGGDIDIATSVPANPADTPVVTMISLAVANISSNFSTDRGQTFQHNPASAYIAADDRQWIEATGENTVYMVYRAPLPSNGLIVQKSTDHAFTWGAPSPVIDPSNPLTTSPGYIDIDHNDGTVYVSHQNDNACYVSRSTDGGTTWTTRLVDSNTAHGHLFDPVKVGDDGTVYVAWSNDRHIYYSFSLDHGDTWTPGAIVSDPDETLTNVFPWLEAGTAGRVDVVWFGTRSENIGAAEWDVYFSQSLNANSGAPVFRQQIISDHRIHGSNISEGGLTGAANRNLGDYFQIAYDPQGAAVVAFADDHNDFDGNTYVTRQLDGSSLLAHANGNGTVGAVGRTSLPPVSFADPEVTDPIHDAMISSQPVLTDSPFDIVSIDYFSDMNGPSAPYIGARMKLSGLDVAAPPGLWRIALTANAPHAVDQLPYGVSDHGDMFYLLAADTSGTPEFTYGTAYRDSAPLVPVVFAAFAMAYNPPAGVCDSGYIDVTNSTVTIKIAISKLNALIAPGHPPITQGSWIAGLRGTAGTPGNGPRDNTRGGLFNLLVNYEATAVGSGPGGAALAITTAPNPSPGRSEVRWSMPAAGHARVGIYDVQGRLVRALFDGRATAGPHAMRWDGRSSDGTRVENGMYFARVRVADSEVSSRVAVVH